MGETYDVGYKNCQEEGCDKRVKAHAWGQIKADGWFFGRDGSVFCPDHLPDWVEKWRKSRRKKSRSW